MKKRKPEPSRPFRHWYIQDWGVYNNETPIFVGHSAKEITAAMKRARLKPEAIELWQSEEADHQRFMDSGVTGFMWFNKAYTLLWLKQYNDYWDDYDVIIHECFHAVLRVLGRSKNMIRDREDFEDEAMAYMIEYLFRNIRKKLQAAYHKGHERI